MKFALSAVNPIMLESLVRCLPNPDESRPRFVRTNTKGLRTRLIFLNHIVLNPLENIGTT